MGIRPPLARRDKLDFPALLSVQTFYCRHVTGLAAWAETGGYIAF
jgi:hypothetical protein